MKTRLWIRMAVLLLALCLALPLGAFAEGASEGEEKGYRLEQVTILSRHNIRSPLSAKGSLVSDITPYEWFEWTSNTGELSLRGAMLETTMGQYFRLWLEAEGLFPENYIPEEGAVRFYANGLQRTQATAHYFSTGLLPVAVVPVERKGEYNEADATFLPLIPFMSDAYEQVIRDEVTQRGGGEGLAGYRASLENAVQVLKRVTEWDRSEPYLSGKYGDLETDGSVLILKEGDEPRISGPIKHLVSIADALVLQYYEEPDDLKAAFGHEMTEEDWKTAASVLSTYETILFTAPSLAPALSNLIMKELLAEMTTEGRKFTFLCGHDSTIASCLAALEAEEYELPGAVESLTPIGAKVVFSRWSDAEGNSFYRVQMVYQSVEQLRSIQPLSLNVPPMIVDLAFKGLAANEDGMIPAEDMLNRLKEKIRFLDEIQEMYGDEGLENAA